MHRIVWVLAVVAIVTVIIVGHLYQDYLPSRVPSHWNSAGVVDDWQSPAVYVWSLPLLTLILVGVLGGMSMGMTDHVVKRSIAASAGLLTCFMLSMHALIGIRVIEQQSVSMHEFMRLIAGLFMGLAFVIRDVPPNHVVGFRFPWTLHNPRVWHQSQRAGFWGMVIGGMGMIVVTLLPVAQETMFIVGMSVLLSGILIPTLYSAWIGHRKSVSEKNL